MTFHPRSVVEFGLFFTQVSDSLLSGAPLEQSAELIRKQLSGSAAAIRIEDRFGAAHAVVVIAEDGAGDYETDEVAPGITREEVRLAEFLETSHHVSASITGEADGTRYSLFVFRDLSASGFDTEEASVCEILVSQLRRGVELSARLGATEIERALYSSVMDRLSVGIVMLDASGRIVKCSASAEEALSERDGLQVQAGRLRATSAREDRDLQAAIKAAAQSVATGETPASRGLSLTKLSGNRNLGIIVQPIPAERRTGLATSATIAVYIRDPEANSEVEGELVRQLFDLTPAEAAVARRLTAGLSLEDAASSLDISRNTARAHLRSIFSKSGITRQTELVRLVLNSAAVLGERPRQIA
jgi:DNA-binding CsgD family transcriptional regulator/PAS domain-containing protein